MTARCLIPAAGRGRRLWPVTATIPKPLLPIGTRPMLQWCLTEALEGGFEEIAVVVGADAQLLTTWLREGWWREGLLPAVAGRGRDIEVTTVRQERPAGLVDAILSHREWVESGLPFAVLLPDNVRIAGPPPMTAPLVAEADRTGAVLAACHRVGPEARHAYGNVGRAELERLVPAGVRPPVATLQERGSGSFRAAPEGSWRLAPRVAVTASWIEAARGVMGEAALRTHEAGSGVEADDVAVHQRLVERGILRAVLWEGTLVDAGHPAGYLYAQHLLHEAAARGRDEEDQGRASSGES